MIFVPQIVTCLRLLLIYKTMATWFDLRVAIIIYTFPLDMYDQVANIWLSQWTTLFFLPEKNLKPLRHSQPLGCGAVS